MELVIRPLETTDAANLLALLAQLQQESTTFMVANDLTHLDSDTQADNISYLMSTTNNIVLVLADESTQQLLGLITATAIPGHPTIAEVGVAVLAAYQGNGFAQALIEELLSWALDYSSVTQLILTVQAHNVAAIHIYEKYAFERIADSETLVKNLADESVAAFDMRLMLEK
ncbi:MAG: GNAT family N-acetyltransferase [Lactobacillaceae bacterium]|jgi:RimJ/RimL family protein N-acetyltransferase|nr:GNAT family N-acetyltransferase [Lactobacillaceae bacterium]